MIVNITLLKEGEPQQIGRSVSIFGCAQIARIMRLKQVIKLASLPVLAVIGSGTLCLPLGAQGDELMTSSTSCQLTTADRQWIEGALADWRFAEVHELKLEPTRLPVVVLFDDHCQYKSAAAATGDISWTGSFYQSTVLLPNGIRIPNWVVSFAAPVDGSSAAGFFVMSLPSVWRSHNIQSGLGLERLMNVVLLHEMSHARQFYFANPIMDGLSARYHLGVEIGDDSIQDTFSKDPRYVKAYERERDLLYEAAAASTNHAAKKYARQALREIRHRRQKWFTGGHAYWNTVDDLFLTMEGIGQWTAYAWLTDPNGPNLKSSFALSEVRRKRNHWTQDEGLALMLVIDRLVPEWQKLAFAPEPQLAESLLKAAAR
ncbi:hypothetical protein DYQ86_15350 [Acidobacteria bacterium AB60]|nr:hypothetical protein DYQ86_15350 [Acidobacteria bacterium AB60]